MTVINFPTEDLKKARATALLLEDAARNLHKDIKNRGDLDQLMAFQLGKAANALTNSANATRDLLTVIDEMEAIVKQFQPKEGE